MTAVKSAHKQRKVIGRPFPKGVSGNPSGRPVGSISIMGKLKQMWADDPDDLNKFVMEIRKDKMMRREILQQIDGKPIQPIAGVEGRPLQVIIDKALEHELTSSSATNRGE